MIGILIYLAMGLLILIPFILRQRKREKKNKSILTENIEAGLTQPASLHPIIDPVKCIGCGACALACPEWKHDVLGLVKNKAQLINPTECIGHGACRAVCPAGAITLVFGTSERGMDLPVVDPKFETTVPGLYVAGELGGMGLIKNALTQGVEAVDYIKESLAYLPKITNLLIIGGGPAGLGAALKAQSLGLSYAVIEQDDLGGAVFKYPRRKLVMTSPVVLPLVGKVHFKTTTKEELLKFWNSAKDDHSLNFKYKEQVLSIKKESTCFSVTTSKGNYLAEKVLLTIGRRGTPRKLEVIGEDHPKVVYNLIDPDQYKGMHVLVVGGGDSAIEAAWSIASSGGFVTLSYRGSAFNRAKPANRQRVGLLKPSNLNVLLNSNVLAIANDEAFVKTENGTLRVPNEAVIICLGGVLPSDFLKDCGIELITKWGEA